jgi:DNA-binding FadR family transcriptional regulator
MDDDLSITRSAAPEASGYDHVLGFVREQLLSGKLRVGDRLLPERELALKLGVSRPVIREVLRALAAMGVIDIRHGHGSVVRQPDFTQFGEMFTLMLAQRADAVDDIMQARIAIERQAIRLACERATLADLDRLRKALADIERTVTDPLHGGQADFAFHAALVESAHSPTLSSLYAAISTLLQRSHLQRRERINTADGIEKFLVDHHRRLLDALAERKADSADMLLMQHFAIGTDFQRSGRLLS